MHQHEKIASTGPPCLPRCWLPSLAPLHAFFSQHFFYSVSVILSMPNFSLKNDDNVLFSSFPFRENRTGKVCILKHLPLLLASVWCESILSLKQCLLIYPTTRKKVAGYMKKSDIFWNMQSSNLSSILAWSCNFSSCKGHKCTVRFWFISGIL